MIPGQPGTSRDSDSAAAGMAHAGGLRGLAGRAIQEATPPPGARLADPITERIHESLLTDRLSRILRREAEGSGIACDGVDS